ncbi:MAG: glycosyl hydrolase 2 galactose-binding domain-containing protein, partial [Anaerolineae bacterium]
MTRQLLDLSGTGWKLGRAPTASSPGRADWDELRQITEWLQATVPGNVRADLVRAGRIPDLFAGTQAEDSQWVDGHSWWLVRDWHLPPSPGTRVHLVFRGVDYLWDLFLNEHHLARHEGMFSPLVLEVTALLRSENRLAVRVTGSKWLPAGRSTPWFRLINHLESKAVSIGKRHPHRRDTLKCQMSFGWDFAPSLRTMGIWDDVYAIVSGDPFIRDIEVTQELGEDQAQLAIRVKVDARVARTALLRCTLTGEGFDAIPVVVERTVRLEHGASHHALTLQVREPHLWWPWDQGSPDLYRLTAEVWDDNRCLDAHSRTLGLRQVELDGWRLRINGRPVYARGANWVPADVLPGRVKEGDYRE